MRPADRLSSDNEACRERERVWSALAAYIEENRKVPFPRPPDDSPRASFDPTRGFPSPGALTGPFGGVIGEYRFVFEGEDDLLHLLLMRTDGAALERESALEVAEFLTEGVPKSLKWLRLGPTSLSLYLGHDLLLQAIGAQNSVEERNNG
ncbi:MAG: hypothetical protein QY327_05465 [Fimbriimonadaceae bacterium]|nr:MAG: hypothetical protein QY327_05465 [Fimbriimonadaceae bacterium]